MAFGKTGFMALTCAVKGANPQDGNYIAYVKDKSKDKKNKLHLINVNAESCKPKPKNCHCKTMLGSLLNKFLDVDEIEGYFMANPFMKGCRCYLGTAARAGFKFVQFHSEHKECNEKLEFSPKNYTKLCNDFERLAKKCGEDSDTDDYGNGVITKL